MIEIFAAIIGVREYSQKITPIGAGGTDVGAEIRCGRHQSAVYGV